jgi:predicted nuclease of predicted toxin-antitoxin system
MKFVVDMNLSPEWCLALKSAGWDAVHWSTTGDPTALDQEILAWASSRSAIVLTQDLDFGAILAATRADAPSVVLLRTQDAMPDVMGARLIRVLQESESALESGALVIVDQSKSRVRILPLHR